MILHALTAIDFNDLHLSKVLLPIWIGSRHIFDIKWYSIAYIAGIVVGWIYLMRLLRAPGAPMASRHAEDLVFYATLGIILGGRIGYVAFYDPKLFTSLNFFMLWEGGMSFHGGVIGTTLGIILFARRHKLDWLRIHDYVACCAPFGLFFGRLANFVNGELWGRPADPNLPWAVIFHGTPNDVARHPSQLYEAGLEGIVLFAILWFAFWKTKARYQPGKLVGLFVLFYGLFRYFVEFFREPDSQYMDSPILGVAGMHMGQLLCIPMIVLGIYLIWTAKGRRTRVTPIAGDEAVA
ncbi:MAG: prolipoprotein diacylglyceryl transferase [Sphingomonas sp.]|uniref:prolipoprotein diacylglyceryl transferase n=1 Tax=Sphingomonas sp. TaxID=28214 RepID=UPI001AD06BFF|nr:prolipoprotein diacylglyceryl transferase [Sphingomonas sp.]MBN8816620.1 prolipoprotein diacylglyceryl transferase [Sphingomonas sp.]